MPRLKAKAHYKHFSSECLDLNQVIVAPNKRGPSASAEWRLAAMRSNGPEQLSPLPARSACLGGIA